MITKWWPLKNVSAPVAICAAAALLAFVSGCGSGRPVLDAESVKDMQTTGATTD
jgi:hypothetical protein